MLWMRCFVKGSCNNLRKNILIIIQCSIKSNYKSHCEIITRKIFNLEGLKGILKQYCQERTKGIQNP